MRSSRRPPGVLSMVLVGSLSTYCSLALDLDRYSFDANEAGSSGSGGEAGQATTGGTAGSDSGGSGGVTDGGDGPLGGAGGEAGAGGAPGCDDDDGPTNPNCELVPVVLYASQETSCVGPNVLGFAIEDSGALRTTPLPVTVSPCANGALFVAPSRRHVITLSTANNQPITHTYDIDPATFDLSMNLEAQPTQESGNSWDTGAVFPGPEGMDHDFFLAANTLNIDNPSSEGVYLFAIDRVTNPGRITELDRSDASGPWGPVVHPSGRFVYHFSTETAVVRQLVFDAEAGTLMAGSSAQLLDSLPKQLAVDASGGWLYVLHERTIRSNSVRSQDGVLTPFGVPMPAPTNVFFHRFALHPGGRFLYVVGVQTDGMTPATTLRAYESNDGTLSALDLDGDPMNGLDNGLALDTTGVIQDVAIDAPGRSLYVATRDRVHSVAIGSDGRLTERTPATTRGAYRLALLHAWRPKR